MSIRRKGYECFVAFVGEGIEDGRNVIRVLQIYGRYEQAILELLSSNTMIPGTTSQQTHLLFIDFMV